MPFQVELPKTFTQAKPCAGMWICSGSPVAAEIAGSSGFEWVLIDAEHSPYGLETVVSLLRATDAYPITQVVRLPVNDTALIKQYLDLGAQNLMIPMVDTAEETAAAVAAMYYPPKGVRGVGSALARSSRWNGVPDYLHNAGDTVNLIVQIESQQAVDNAEAIVATEGVDAVFIGPSDLAASMGLIGQQQHPDVLAAVDKAMQAAIKAGVPVGVNAFNRDQARAYLDAGAEFVLVGADVQLLATSARNLAEEFKTD